jgi:lycopene beta-cyclase
MTLDPSPVSAPDCDILIAGGGLAAGLIAMALAAKQPHLDVRIVESGARLGGNHLWSFFAQDVDPDHRWLVDPLISYRWDDYDIAFPAYARTIAMTYHSIESAQFDQVVRARVPVERIIKGEVATLSTNAVILNDQRKITATRVIDARGPGDLSLLDLGWQKFLGQELVIEGGHGLTRPIIMDATVPQLDGYRFVYCLPFSADTVFVEDTYYSDTTSLDVPSLRQRIGEYAAHKDWKIREIVREETGVLPVAMGGDFDAYWDSSGEGVKAGLRAGLFHPTTGYSLPDAIRLAIRIADDPMRAEEIMQAEAKAIWKARGFYRMLDTMLFRAAEPDQRYKILERFYRLSDSLIGRFYAGNSTLFDKMRILSGKPPVPIGRAISAIMRQRTKGNGF